MKLLWKICDPVVDMEIVIFQGEGENQWIPMPPLPKHFLVTINCNLLRKRSFGSSRNTRHAIFPPQRTSISLLSLCLFLPELWLQIVYPTATKSWAQQPSIFCLIDFAFSASSCKRHIASNRISSLKLFTMPVGLPGRGGGGGGGGKGKIYQCITLTQPPFIPAFSE